MSINRTKWLLLTLAYVSTQVLGASYTYPGQEDKKAVVSFLKETNQGTEQPPTDTLKPNSVTLYDSDNSQWVHAGKYASSFFSHWLDSWESMNVEYFLSNYSSDFNNGSKNFSSWAKNKRRLSKAKVFINVNATNVSLLENTNNQIMVATFHQDYTSNNFSDQSWKRQYWKKESDQRWRIIYENEISGPDAPLLAQFAH